MKYSNKKGGFKPMVWRLGILFFVFLCIIAIAMFRNRPYYFGPYQSIIDSLYEDVLAIDGIDSIEIETHFSEAYGETRTWFAIYGEGADCYLEDTTLFEEVFVPYLVENNDLTTALLYECADDCNHRHIGNRGDYLEIRINNEVYTYATPNYYQEWYFANETINLRDYR